MTFEVSWRRKFGKEKSKWKKMSENNQEEKKRRTNRNREESKSSLAGFFHPTFFPFFGLTFPTPTCQKTNRRLKTVG